MTEQEEFFSKKHNRLLNIATWAKYLAWIALGAYIILAGLTVYQNLMSYQQIRSMPGVFQNKINFWEIINQIPLYFQINIGTSIVSNLLRGFIYFIVLKAVSLGLTMVVETDINYRDRVNGDA